MSFYPILSAPGCNGETTLHNFPPNNWEYQRRESRLINLTWLEGDHWCSTTLGELDFGAMRTFRDSDVKMHVPEGAVPLLSMASAPYPEQSVALPMTPRFTAVPNWRATLGLRSPRATTCYQGELDPFPRVGTLLTFAPFIQIGVGIENYLLLLNLESSTKKRASVLEVYNSAFPSNLLESFEVFNNAISIVRLDGLGLNCKDLPVIICKGMSGIPLYFSKTQDGAYLSLEHTHPPASYVIHGRRWEVQKILKKNWFAKLGHS